MTNPADSPRLRLGILGIVTISLFAALFARLWYLQVLVAPEYRLAAENNQVRVVSDQAPRGRILDREGRVLVDNRASNVVFIERTELDPDERDLVLERLSALLAVPVEDLEVRLDDQRASPYRPVPLAEDVSEEVMVRLRERKEDFPEVTADRVAVRTYPHGSLAAHVLGYVGEILPEELVDRKGDYELGDVIGRAGIERMYEEDLQGMDGELRIEVDADGDPVRIIDRRPPVQGNDLVLSLDLDVQAAAEQNLLDGLMAARQRQFEEDGPLLVADAGSVVVLDAKEASVVAMASWPTFDPNALANGVSTEEAANLFAETTGAPFTNRAVQGQYAPGSTFKLVTATAALRSGLITPSTTIFDRGVFTIPNCRGGKCDWQNAERTTYGTVDVRRALTVSSDVFFYSLGHDFWERRGTLGETVIQDTAALYGLGAESGVPVPAEADGRVPTPALVAERHESQPELFPEGNWYTGDNLNLAIGQGEMALTPLQLANAYAMLANSGTRHAPNLVLQVREQDGTVLRTEQPRVVTSVPLPPGIRGPLMDGFTGVTRPGDGGTAVGAFAGWPHDSIPVAGKTGTAQAKPKQDTSLFVAMAPANDPRYVMSVVMEQSGFGATAAAPVARNILATIYGISPTAPPPPDAEAAD